MSPDDGKIVSAQRVAQIDVNAAEKAIVGKLAVALAGSAKPLSPAHATDGAALLALFRVPAPPAGATAAEIAEFVERRARATESVVTMTMAMFNAEEQHTLRKVLDAETAAAEKALRAAGQR